MMNSILLGCLVVSFCHRIVDSADVCGIKKESGPCFASIQRWHFDSESGMCRKFTYGGCRGNGNNFRSELECQSTCRDIVCRLPADDGTCRGYFPSWYYDPADGQCKEFVYGGCEGNANNFWTEEKCENVCSGENSRESCKKNTCF